MTAIPNFELESVFLSFGEHVRVLSPPTLRSRIKRRLKKALGGY